MQVILLPGSPSTAEELWQQCLSGDCTDLVLCCDDGFLKTHKAILVSCLPWLKDADTDTVIMPGISVEKLKEAIKEFYLTSESKATLWYFCCLFKPCLVAEQFCPTECDVVVKIDKYQDLNSGLDEDLNSGIDESYLEQGFICKEEVHSSSDSQFKPLLELEQNFNSSLNGTKYTSGSSKVAVYKCKYCKKRFHTASGREKHMVEHHAVTFDCDICGCKLNTDQASRRHKRTKHPELFKLHCNICGCGFTNKISRDEHVQKCDGLENQAKRDLHNCSVCGEGLTSIKALKAHMNVHDPNYGNYECNECGTFFASKGLLKHHRKISQHKDRVKGAFPCTICGKVVSRPSVLKEHIKSVHDKIFDKECPHCDYKASNNISLKKHIESSHLGITYPCDHDQCNEVFTHYVNLDRHKKHVHSDVRPFVCEECGTGFKRKSTLERHIASIHSTTSYPCGQCGKLFKTEAYVASHMKAHDESSQFPCHFCTRKFVTRTKLRMHINTHTGETPYKCPRNCGKAFHSSDQLSHHKKQCQEIN